MRIAITEEQHAKMKGKISKEAHQTFDRSIKKTFKKFSSKDELEKQLKHEANLWRTYKVRYLDDVSREQFQCYCCGWLQYYDEIVRNGSINHTIWFHWTKTTCEVYIWPRPKTRRDAKSSLTATSATDPGSPTAPPPPQPQVP